MTPGEYGCGVAIGGDWPNCGEKFCTDYNFDVSAVMASSQRGAGRPVWRYDWRSTQYPASEPYDNWHYLAMDWCPQGGMGEHPDPWGPWPGLLGWNEPNSDHQCNQPAWDVSEFVALAKQFKALGKFVVSPAPTHDAHDWMDTFLGVMHDRTDDDEHFMGVDYLAYHHYVSCDDGTSGDDIFAQLEGMLLNFKGLMDKWNGEGMQIKGLWLTEVACGWSNNQWTGHCSDSCTKNTMLKLLDLTRKYPVLKTWAWFGYNNFGNLWENDPANGYPLTELGQMYFANCDPHGFSDRAVNKSSVGSSHAEVVGVSPIPLPCPGPGCFEVV